MLAQAAARVEIDGVSPTPDQILVAALDGYGHFTAMQVRNGRVRGLDLHLDRLTSAHSEMFGTSLDAETVRAYIRHGLGPDTSDASVRVYLRQPQDQPSVMVTVRPPAELPAAPWRLRTVPYQRSVAHIKHLGDFGQGYYQRQVRRDGFDEALLTGPNGVVCEGSITNVGFFDADGVVWPDAPMLVGITMAVVDARLSGVGLASRRIPIRVADVAGFDGAFVTNARGIAPVGEIDGVPLPVPAELMTRLTTAYACAPADLI